MTWRVAGPAFVRLGRATGGRCPLHAACPKAYRRSAQEGRRIRAKCFDARASGPVIGWNGLWKQARPDAFCTPSLSPVAGTEVSG
jgi:hypothetical protein